MDFGLASRLRVFLAQSSKSLIRLRFAGRLTVSLETPAPEVVRRMLECKVPHLFVIDGELALVGVVSPVDVLRHLEK